MYQMKERKIKMKEIYDYRFEYKMEGWKNFVIQASGNM